MSTLKSGNLSMSRAEVWLKRSLKFLLVFLGVLVFLSVPSIDSKERVDKGFVYKKQVIVNVVNNKEEGIGLGLNIVKDIVENYGGEIKVERSETLHGAKFVVLLPKGGNEE